MLHWRIKLRAPLIQLRNLSTTTAWKLPEIHKDVIGLRTLVISADDSHSKELSQRMWFENQKVGIESGFYTVKTAFSTPFSVQEGLEMVRRTGAKSIITIGSSSVCDIGKGIQSLMIKGLKTVDELDQQTILAEAETDTSRIQSNNRTSSSSALNNKISAKGNSLDEASFPHFSIPMDLSPSYARSQWSALHKEDDVLVRRKCFSPQAVLYDSEILESSKLYSAEATRSYLLSDLFDTFFLHFLNFHGAKGIETLTTKESRENNHRVGVEKMTEIGTILLNDPIVSTALLRPFSLSICGTEGSTADLTGAVEALVRVRLLLLNTHSTYTQHSTDTGASSVSSSQSLQNNIDKDRDRDTVVSADTGSTLDKSIPSTLESASILAPATTAPALVPTIPIEKKQHDYSCDFGPIETASLVYILRSYQRGLPLPHHWVRALGLKQCLLLVSQVTKNKSSLSKLSAAEYPIVSSAVLANNLICTLLNITEGDLLGFSNSNVTSLINSKLYINQLKTKNKKKILAPPGQKVPETDGDGMGPEGLIEGWVVTEEMALEKLNKNASSSLVLKMLRSDFIIELTEGIFKYEK